MKILAYVLGILTGLAFSRIPHYIDQYADHSLPKAWEGPKMRVSRGGTLVDGAWPPPVSIDPQAFEEVSTK